MGHWKQRHLLRVVARYATVIQGPSSTHKDCFQALKRGGYTAWTVRIYTSPNRFTVV